MTKTFKSIAKGGIATATLGAMALAGATPAQARDRNDGGISTGDVIAGAVIIGGIAAIAAAVGNNNDRYDTRHGNRYDYRDGNRYRDQRGYGYGDRWQARGNPRAAVEQCINAVERDARRAGYRFADVTQIRDVDDARYGWRVRGNLVVDAGRHNSNWGSYNRYDRNDRRGWGHDRSDAGRFDCRIERGRVDFIDYSGVRGLR